MNARQRLWFFLLHEFEYLKEHKADKELLNVLNVAVTGLENLEFGQVDAIFAPSKKGLHGLRPADVKRYQAHAIGIIFALQKKGYKVGKADEQVASAYGVTIDNLLQWKKTLKNTKSEVLREIVAFHKYRVMFSKDTAGTLAALKKMGMLYQKACTPKKVKIVQ